MPRYLHDHSKIHYVKTSNLTVIGYEVRLREGDELVGLVRRSSTGKAWVWHLNGSDGWTRTSGTRKDAADHLLSAYSPSAAWLI